MSGWGSKSTGIYFSHPVFVRCKYRYFLIHRHSPSLNIEFDIRGLGNNFQYPICRIIAPDHSGKLFLFQALAGKEKMDIIPTFQLSSNLFQRFRFKIKFSLHPSDNLLSIHIFNCQAALFEFCPLVGK